MSPAETAAFNAGVSAVIGLAQASADAMISRLVEKPTRYNFAAGALQAIADEGEALLLPLPASSPTAPIPARSALPTPIGAAAPIAAAARKRCEARAQGYIGEACTDCGNFTLTRNGTCLKCDTCGATSGCS